MINKEFCFANPFQSVKDFVRGNAQAINELKPIIENAYKTKNFKGLAQVIIDKVMPWNNEMGTHLAFCDWIRDIEEESLPITSSGSFWTALTDAEWIYTHYSQFEEERIEELEEIWNEELEK
jgi:hypothetical protein